MEVAGFAEQFAAPMDHRLNVRVAEFGGFLDAPLEGLVVVADEFEVNANVDFAHKSGSGVMECWSVESDGH